MTLDQRLTQAARGLADRVTPPEVDLEVVRNRARANRRRTVSLAGAGALAAVVVVATLLGGMPGSDRSTDPVVNPTDGRTDEERLAWAPDRIRAEGDPLDYVEGRDGALAARFWSVCERANCDHAEWGTTTTTGCSTPPSR